MRCEPYGFTLKWVNSTWGDVSMDKTLVEQV